MIENREEMEQSVLVTVDEQYYYVIEKIVSSYGNNKISNKVIEERLNKIISDSKMPMRIDEQKIHEDEIKKEDIGRLMIELKEYGIYHFSPIITGKALHLMISIIGKLE